MDEPTPPPARSRPTTASSDPSSSPTTTTTPLLKRYHALLHHRLLSPLKRRHARLPYSGYLPLPALLLITLLLLLNLLTWAVVSLILTLHPIARNSHLLGTAALAYSLGLRHALDADHISAIDLMTRRLVASGQRPVSVGTWFSLGHSTIVIVTSIVVAATAAGVSSKFDGFGKVGGIIGTSVSAGFLLVLGGLNAWILWRLVGQMGKVVEMGEERARVEGLRVEGGGVMFRVLKRMFRLIDRAWKMYPLGVLFGLGFDTSSEIALLGISSIQGARGTGLWLIMVFPVLFTVGMCLVDTMDGALMMSLYVAPMGMDGKGDEGEGRGEVLQQRPSREGERNGVVEQMEGVQETPTTVEGGANRVKDPLTFLYYSIVLTTLTVICAIVIGIIQLLTLVLNVAEPTGPFWDGVAAAGDSYEIIGGAICASFVVAGITSVLFYGRFKRWVQRKRARMPHAEVLGPPYRDDVRAVHDANRRSGEEDGGRIVAESVEYTGAKTSAGKSSALVRGQEVGGEASAAR